jgi:hypothetical protein
MLGMIVSDAHPTFNYGYLVSIFISLSKVDYEEAGGRGQVEGSRGDIELGIQTPTQ